MKSHPLSNNHQGLGTQPYSNQRYNLGFQPVDTMSSSFLNASDIPNKVIPLSKTLMIRVMLCSINIVVIWGSKTQELLLIAYINIFGRLLLI